MQDHLLELQREVELLLVAGQASVDPLLGLPGGHQGLSLGHRGVEPVGASEAPVSPHTEGQRHRREGVAQIPGQAVVHRRDPALRLLDAEAAVLTATDRPPVLAEDTPAHRDADAVLHLGHRPLGPVDGEGHRRERLGPLRHRGTAGTAREPGHEAEEEPGVAHRAL